jgi:murein L,D-transpeptidase YcbB/YkuD
MCELNLHVSKLILIYLLIGGFLCSHEPAMEKGSSATELVGIDSANWEAPTRFTEKNSITQDKLDSISIIHFLVAYPELNQLKKDLLSFYQQRGFSNAWLNQNIVAEHTYIIYNKILQLIDHGIPYGAPYIDQFKSIMEDRFVEEIRNELDKELLISCQYLYFINNINTNIADKDIESLSWFIKKKRIDPESFYNSILADKAEKINNDLYPQYYLLLDAFKKYTLAKQSGKWNSINANKKSFKPLDTSVEISQIKRNLYLLGDLTVDSGDSIYDAAMINGVYSFQQRHGLKKQEMVESQFIKMMNVPLQSRIEQILINMERCKWLPNETNQDFIIVNIPQFSLEAFSGDSLMFKCKVVVGKETNRTMIFKGDMKYIVFSPYWNVPASILKNEIIPAIQKNPNYLIENDMEWFNGILRQRPGEANALGRVKFIFPNIFNIYLHDTPSKMLFELEKRTFSHGCIRISEPVKMVKFLLRKDSTWDDNRILDAMYTGREKSVKLNKAVPVYVIYLTSFVDELGKLNFREDIYKRDNALKEILINKKSIIGD